MHDANILNYDNDEVSVYGQCYYFGSTQKKGKILLSR